MRCRMRGVVQRPRAAAGMAGEGKGGEQRQRLGWPESESMNAFCDCRRSVYGRELGG